MLVVKIPTLFYINIAYHCLLISQ